MFSWIKFQLALSGLLVFFCKNGDLFLVELLAVESFVHFHYLLLLFLEFLFSFFLCRHSITLNSLWCLLNIVQWLSEFQIDICLNYADLVVRLTIDDIDQVVLALMVNIDSITLKTSSILGQFSFQDSFGVWKIDERSLVRLNLHKSTFEQGDISENNFSSFFEVELVHEPNG